NLDNEIFLNKFIYEGLNNFIVYNGSFFDLGAKISNLIFPINLFFEYSGLVLNFEGKLRKLLKIINFNIYNSVDLLKSLFIYINLKFLKFLFLLKNFKNFIKFFSKFKIF